MPVRGAPPPGLRSRNVPPRPLCPAPAAGRPCRSGHGPIRGRWRHPAGERWRKAADHSHGLHRRPRDGPAPLQRRVPAAPARAGPGRFGGVASHPDHRQVRPHRGRGVPGWPIGQFGDGDQRPGLSAPRACGYAYRQYLSECEQVAYLGAEVAAQRQRIGLCALPGGIQRPWDWHHGTRPPAASTAAPFLPAAGSAPPAAAPAGGYSGRRLTCRQIGSLPAPRSC